MKDHTPVLLQEILEYLSPKKGETVLDATLGLGGHASALCEAIGNKGILIGIDEDRDAIDIAKKTLTNCRARVFLGNFRNLDKYLKEAGAGKANKILFDLGMSSLQLDDKKRGFSFKTDAPLKMTFKKEGDGITAEDIVSRWNEDTLVTIFRQYGEERFAKKIAQIIVKSREKKKITTTLELVKLIETAVPIWYRKKKIHPATKVFQSLRIVVNDEIGALKEALPKGWDSLANGGRLAVISFHSLEDRIVKNYFRDLKNEQKGILINKKPITPLQNEIRSNPRSRSSKLRVIEKL